MIYWTYLEIRNKMKQVIIIRKDLKMRYGKGVAQGSHASISFILNNPNILNSKNVKKWIKSGQKKICLYVESEEELLDIYNKAIQAGLICSLITDSGLTEFHGVPTKTCVAIGPNNEEEIDKITKDLKLL